MLRRTIRSHFLWAGLILAIVLVGFFSRTLFTDELNSPADILQLEPTFALDPASPSTEVDNILVGDPVIQFEPWYEFARRSRANGESLLWNPYQGNGVPHLANSQSALLFPPTWLVLALGYKWGLLLNFALKLWLIGFCTYGYLRALSCRFGPALLGAVIFMFAGSNLVWLYWPIPTVMFYLPLALWCIERATRRPRSLWPYLGFALTVAAGFLAGHVQTFTHITLIAVAYLGFRLLTSLDPRRDKLRVAAGLAVAGLVGLGVAGAQLVPFIEYLRNSAELVARSSGPNPYGLPLRVIGLNLVPDLLGNQGWASSREFLASDVTNYNDTTSGYIGFAALVGAVSALLLLARRKLVWFYALLAAGCLGLVYRAPYWYDWITKAPVISTMNHIRLLFAVAFAGAVLCALFWNFLLEQPRSELVKARGRVRLALLSVPLLTFAATGSLILAGFGATSADPARANHYTEFLRSVLPWLTLDLVAVTLVYLWTRWRRLALLSVLALVIVETGLHGLWYEPATPPAQHYPETELTRYLVAHAQVDRFIGLSDSAHVWPNLGMYYGFADPRLYDSMAVARQRTVLREHLDTIGNTQAVVKADLSYLEAMGVRYLLAADQAELARKLGLEKDALSRFRPVFTTPHYTLFENTSALPRAFFATAPNFYTNPATLVKGASVLIDRYTNTRVVLSAHVPSDGYIILTDTYYPGWQAYVDGEPYQIQEADLSVRAVPIKAGAHQVELRYEPTSWRTGVGLSGLSVGIILAGALAKWGATLVRYVKAKNTKPKP